ncbi:MAG: hypothetical protein HW380_3358 [Magnetococcales bacterium]|nr:hypothetical protein [Magnetococcales bacterium]
MGDHGQGPDQKATAVDIPFVQSLGDGGVVITRLGFVGLVGKAQVRVLVGFDKVDDFAAALLDFFFAMIGLQSATVDHINPIDHMAPGGGRTLLKGGIDQFFRIVDGVLQPVQGVEDLHGTVDHLSADGCFFSSVVGSGLGVDHFFQEPAHGLDKVFGVGLLELGSLGLDEHGQQGGLCPSRPGFEPVEMVQFVEKIFVTGREMRKHPVGFGSDLGEGGDGLFGFGADGVILGPGWFDSGKETL